MTFRIYRIRKHESGGFAGRDEVYHPYPYADGNYALGPRSRTDRHHTVAKVNTPDLNEVVRLLRTGDYCLRMRGDLTKQINMVRPDDIIIEES